MTTTLFSEVVIRGMVLKNRVVVSPMCMFSCFDRDGVVGDYHLVHLGKLATGGAGLVIAEATAVEPNGRISLEDCGIWNDDQVRAWQRVVSYMKSQAGTAVGIQIAHAGRKAGTRQPWDREKGAYYTPDEVAPYGFEVIGPSSERFHPKLQHIAPKMMNVAAIKKNIEYWKRAALNAVAAGFDVIELHFAHGYLVSEFYSPLVNTQRKDEYGGDFHGRIRLAVEIAKEVRAIIPSTMPLFARINGSDWSDGGWDVEDCCKLSVALAKAGVDVIDISSGGSVYNAKYAPVEASLPMGYQVEFAQRVKQALAAVKSKTLVATVGLIIEPTHAEEIIRDQKADLVLVGRGFLHNSNWGNVAAMKLGGKESWPKQYDPYLGIKSSWRKNLSSKL